MKVETILLKYLVNKYIITVKEVDGKEFLHSPCKDIDSTTMALLKAEKQEIIDFIKSYTKVEEAKNQVSFLATFLVALDRKKKKADESTWAGMFGNEGDDDKAIAEYHEAKKVVEEHEKLYPDDSARANVYKYIRDKSYKLAMKYDDLYFCTIGDRYIDDVVIAPVDTLDSLKKDFDTDMDGYYVFKHDDHPDV